MKSGILNRFGIEIRDMLSGNNATEFQREMRSVNSKV